MPMEQQKPTLNDICQAIADNVAVLKHELLAQADRIAQLEKLIKENGKAE
jgi:hypothetical protein